MSSSRRSRRPSPDAYDHLWALLPVFAAFFAVILYVATTDNDPLRTDRLIRFDALPYETAEPIPPVAADLSVPSAEAAMARLPDPAAEPVDTF